MSNDNWGACARFGIFIVGAEVVPEAEWWAMVPQGVSVHAARVTSSTPWAEWDATRQSVALCDDLKRGAAQFASMGLSAVVVAHSSSSVAGGQGWDEAIVESLRAVLDAKTQVTTNGADCTLALRHLGVRRPFIVWPPWFNDTVLGRGAAYFQAQGFAGPSPYRHVPEARWADVPPEQLYGRMMHTEQRTDMLFDQIVRHCPDEADSVLLVGTGFRCVGIIDALEERLRRPVVSANQASLWRCLGLAGVDARIDGYGALLRGQSDSGSK